MLRQRALTVRSWALRMRCFSLAKHEVLQLGEDLFDGVEVRAVGWEEEELGAGGTDRLAHGFPLVTAEIVQDDNVAGGERRHEHRLDIDAEAVAIDRAVVDPRCIDPVVSQRRQERHGFPAAVGNLAPQPLAARAPATQRPHVRLGPGLIDEDEATGIKIRLMRLPTRAFARHVGTILLAGQHGFF